MAIIASNGSTRTGADGRSRRTVIIADASTAADLVPAASQRSGSIESGWLHFGSACAWEIKSGGVALVYARVTAGTTVSLDPADFIHGQRGAAIQIETSVASTVDGMIEIG